MRVVLCHICACLCNNTNAEEMADAVLVRGWAGGKDSRHRRRRYGNKKYTPM